MLSVTSLAEAQVDCTVDQLNPECVRYVLKHSAGQLPNLGAWPKPPVESLPLVPLARPTAIPLVPAPVVLRAKPMAAAPPQFEPAQPTNQPPSRPTAGCDQDCYSQLGANGATAIIGIVGAVRRHQKNKQFCAANPASCLDNHPCSFDEHLENLTASTSILFINMKDFPEIYAARMPTLHEDSISQWKQLKDESCALFPGICYHDLEGNLHRCPSR